MHEKKKEKVLGKFKKKKIAKLQKKALSAIICRIILFKISRKVYRLYRISINQHSDKWQQTVKHFSIKIFYKYNCTLIKISIKYLLFLTILINFE